MTKESVVLFHVNSAMYVSTVTIRMNWAFIRWHTKHPSVSHLRKKSFAPQKFALSRILVRYWEQFNLSDHPQEEEVKTRKKEIAKAIVPQAIQLLRLTLRMRVRKSWINPKIVLGPPGMWHYRNSNQPKRRGLLLILTSWIMMIKSRPLRNLQISCLLLILVHLLPIKYKILL